MDDSRNKSNLHKIEELYTKLRGCFSEEGCDHVKATSILNSIIERKKFLTTIPKFSRYVDFKRMISHYVKSANQKECNYDEINVQQIEKKILEFSPEQSLHLYQVFKRELQQAGYPEKVDELGRGLDETKLKVYASKKDVKSKIKWISIRVSYRTRYLIYMLLSSFILLNIILLPNDSISFFEFTTKHISDNIFFNHLGNVLIFLLDIDDSVKVEPLNIFGVISMFVGKAFFILFIVNFLLKKIMDKIAS